MGNFSFRFNYRETNKIKKKIKSNERQLITTFEEKAGFNYLWICNNGVLQQFRRVYQFIGSIETHAHCSSSSNIAHGYMKWIGHFMPMTNFSCTPQWHKIYFLFFPLSLSLYNPFLFFACYFQHVTFSFICDIFTLWLFNSWKFNFSVSI